MLELAVRTHAWRQADEDSPTIQRTKYLPRNRRDAVRLVVAALLAHEITRNTARVAPINPTSLIRRPALSLDRDTTCPYLFLMLVPEFDIAR